VRGNGVAEDYTYIVARLRSLEAVMPERAWYDRLVRTPETGLLPACREHYRGFEDVGSPADFEKALEEEKRAMLELITSLLADDGTKQFMRGRYDFNNLTHAWKAAKLEVKPALTPFGLVPAETVAQAVSTRARGILPPYLEGHLEMLDATYEAAKSLAACEYAGEAAAWRFLFGIAPGEGAVNWLRWKVDLVNIKNALRLRRSGLRRQNLDAIWIEGGELDVASLASLAGEAEEEFFAYLASTSYRRLLGFGLSREIALWRVDAVMRQMLMELIGESRYAFFDLSPVLYHIEVRERDFEVLRRIIVGVLNRLPESMVLERVSALLPS
jgi:vacuolar-type H+-ATPase subunit C/Vma6